MSNTKKIKAALISVYYKDGLEPLVRSLHNNGVSLYATGGTQTFIEQLNIPVIPVEDLTSYPSILGGRVKTLHPKVFGGILSRRDNNEDVAQLAEFKIPEIDLVIVDLYPFEETVRATTDGSAIIEKIDIGGISLIRAAAKNYNDVVILSSKNDYAALHELVNTQSCSTTLEQRRKFAASAFAVSSHYDTAIFNWFKTDETVFKQSIQTASALRYGENPHQQGVYYGNLNDAFEKINGKELSYNNLLDIDAAIGLINEFEEPTIAILKHNNASGCASGTELTVAWESALAGDPVSAFGGVIVSNREIEKSVATEMNKLFFEVVIAPFYSNEALQILSEKKNRIILKQKEFKYPQRQFRSILNGVLEQDRDYKTETLADMKPATLLMPSETEQENLSFAMKICKHSKSNTIVLAKNKQLIGSGVGMTSRVDALKHALNKAREFGHEIAGAVMASDAFFPFPDCVEIANNEGIDCVIQPGGSVKDQDSVNYCNAHNMKMVFTGVRHFKH